jgi:hypothetical protein
VIDKRQSPEAQIALDYCEMCANDYDFWFRWNERRWISWQRIAIIAGLFATILGAVTIPFPEICPEPYWIKFASPLWWIRAIPAAIATLATSMLGALSYREDAVRHEITAHALWNEWAKFKTCARPYNTGNEAQDTSRFMNNITRLVQSELRSWSDQVFRTNQAAESSEATEPS